MTEAQIAEILKQFEAMLRDPTVEVSVVNGINHFSDDGCWESAEPNGSRTITIKVKGGAEDTREDMPRCLSRQGVR